MSTSPKVSVIMPVYNAEKYLRESLDSLINQTFSDFEVICVDDGSDDESLRILQEYSSLDSRFTILTQDHSFAGAARNLGIRYANGEYLQFLDADDIFLPEMLETAVKKADEVLADICIFSAESIDDQTGKIAPMPWTCQPGTKQKGVFSGKDDPDRIFCFTTPAPWNKLFRRAFIIENGLEFQNIRSVNDLAFVLTALAVASRIIAINKVLLRYRVNNPKSLKGSQQKDPLVFYDALTEFRQRLIDRGLFDFYQVAYQNQAVSNIYYNLHTLKSATAFEKTYYFIRDTALSEFQLHGHPKDFFYVNLDWDYSERIRTMEEESILDYIIEYQPDLPKLRESWYRNMSCKSFAKLLIGWIRTRSK